MKTKPVLLLLSVIIVLALPSGPAAAMNHRCQDLFRSSEELDPKLAALTHALQVQDTASKAAMDIRRLLFAADTSMSTIDHVRELFLDRSISNTNRNLWTDILLRRLNPRDGLDVSQRLLATHESDPIILRDIVQFARDLKQREAFYRIGLALEYRALKRLFSLTTSQNRALAEQASQVAQTWFGIDALSKVRTEFTKGQRAAIDTAHHLRTDSPSKLAPFKLIPLDAEYGLESDGGLFGVRYFRGPEQLKNRIYFENGRLYDGQGKLLGQNDVAVRFDYVMDQSGFFYGGPAKHDVIHHSSYLAGAAVAGAGEMSVRNGQIETINRKSGHYRPPREVFEQVLKRLDELGASPLTVFDQRPGD